MVPPARRRAPRIAHLALGPAALLLAATALVGCGKDTSNGAATATTAPVGTGTSIVGGAPRTPAADQTPPKGANGVAFRDGVLWVADLAGRQIVVADPADGTILARYSAAQGITSQPDDLAVTRDGTVWWTGFDTGTVGRIGTDGRSTDVATLRPGANPIAVAPDGSLVVGIAVTGDGLFRIDPASPGTPKEIAAAVGNVNAFAFGPDGGLYGPSFSEQHGKVVRVDTATGATTPTATVPGFPVSVRFDRDGAAYVLSTLPSAVSRVDLATGTVTPFATPSTKAVDNMAWGPDGNLYVTGFDVPQVTVIDAKGTVLRSLSIGH